MEVTRDFLFCKIFQLLNFNNFNFNSVDYSKHINYEKTQDNWLSIDNYVCKINKDIRKKTEVNPR